MKGRMKTLKLLIPAFLFIICIQSHAQDQGFIYGTVYTEDGDKYTVPIRWGKEEVYWSDMFNASKRENKNLDYLTDRELDRLKDERGYDNIVSRFVSISVDSSNVTRSSINYFFVDFDVIHFFECIH